MTTYLIDQGTISTRLVSLKGVRAFIAVAETGSFLAAARLLFVDQSSVSRLISALERDLRLTLFHRAPGGASLTVEGEALLEPCRTLLERAELVRLAADALARRTQEAAPEELLSDLFTE